MSMKPILELTKKPKPILEIRRRVLEKKMNEPRRNPRNLA